MGQLEGKTAIVTGAGSGIGRATAQLFAAEGANVLAAEINEAAGQETADLIAKDGGTAIFRRVDVSQPAEVEAMINAAVSEWGRLDVLVNNAGIIGDVGRRTAESTIENWHRIIEVNLTSVFLGLKYAIPQMLNQGGGAIVNIASLAGLVGVPNLSAYSASKGGIVQLTKTAALEYARDNIRINAICPGGVVTGITREMAEKRQSQGDPEPAPRTERPGMGRSADPMELAHAALYLSTDASSFVTGVAFPVDGGAYAS